MIPKHKYLSVLFAIRPLALSEWLYPNHPYYFMNLISHPITNNWQFHQIHVAGLVYRARLNYEVVGRCSRVTQPQRNMNTIKARQV